jgi:hypothetical protein
MRMESARPAQARGLRRVTLLGPIGSAQGLRHLARELRARQEAGTPTPAPGWRRLSPSAELFVDHRTGARCAVQDTGALGAARYLWTLAVFGEHQVAEGHTAELAEAQRLAEAAQTEYIAALAEAKRE